MPRPSASVRTAASHSENDGRVVSAVCPINSSQTSSVRTSAVYIARGCKCVELDAQRYGHDPCSGLPPVAEDGRRRVAVVVPWRTLLKLIAAAALVWAALQLVELALVVVVAILLAVTLN